MCFSAFSSCHIYRSLLKLATIQISRLSAYEALVGPRVRRGEEDERVAQGTSERQEKRALVEGEDPRDPEGDLGTLLREIHRNFLRILIPQE